MRDPLGDLLRAEADRLVADEAVPPPGALLTAPARQTGRIRALAPLVVAASVVALVLGVQQLRPPGRDEEPAVRPTPMPLTQVEPPQVVQTRLGAPSGHLNGPAVGQADVHATTIRDGYVLRTVAASRPSLRIDPQGEPLVDRCLYTYSEPDAQVLHGNCDWGVKLSLNLSGDPMTVEQRRGDGRDYLVGTAPQGTAGLLLTSPGLDRALVSLVDPGPDWQHRPAYLVLWPRGATDVIAVDAEGRELDRVDVPSDEARRVSDDDPELGTVELPLTVRAGFDRSGLHTDLAEPVGRADLLFRQTLRAGVVLSQYGVRLSDGSTCTIEEIADASGEPARGGGMGCSGPIPSRRSPSGPSTSEAPSAEVAPARPSGIGPAPLYAGRSFAAGDGRDIPAQELLNGVAPEGTERVRLTAPGVPEQVVEAYDAGPRWDDRAFFGAQWPSKPHTVMTALDAQGRVLAQAVARGMDPRAYDPQVLADVADCLRKAGVTITSQPQPGDSGPSYQYDYDKIGQDAGRRVTEQCEDAALRD